MAKTVEKEITIHPIQTQTVKVTIEGDSDLILNKMNRRTVEQLTNERKDKGKVIQEINPWDDIITAMHWRDELPEGVYTEETLKDLLKKNAPCISAFGLKKSFGQAVVRNGIDTYSTKFDACMNIIAKGNLIPITFVEHFVDEKLMSPKRGAPVLTRQNRFTGWRATFMIQFMDGGAYSLEQIIQVINLAGFGLGIGSGRTSGFGRYHVVDVK